VDLVTSSSLMQSPCWTSSLVWDMQRPRNPSWQKSGCMRQGVAVPVVFARISANGLDDSENVPAIEDPDNWDNGTTSLRF
jgi:hypothetical protein